MARGMMRFYGHGVVTRNLGFGKTMTLFRFVNGQADVDMNLIMPNEAARLMRRFPYQNLDADGNPTGDRMLNGMVFSGESHGVRVIHNEPKKEVDPDMPKRPAPIQTPEPAPVAPVVPQDEGKVNADTVKAAKNRKEVVALAKQLGVDFGKSDSTEMIRSSIIKHLEG